MSGPATVLVVDDEAEIAGALKDILEDEGFRVLTAADGQEALDVLAKEKPDVILMDVMMPRLTGFDVLRRLDGAEHAPVILMSAVSPQAPQSELGWKHFLKKPFSIDELLGTVKSLSASPAPAPS